MAPEITKDYITDFTIQFELEPNSTALMIVDMQYATASRGTGLGKILKEQGNEELGKYRFDRIESIIIPTIKRLLSFFRKYHLPIIYLTLGSNTPDYSDILPNLKALLRTCNNRVGEKEHEVLEEIRPEPGELVINKTTVGALNSTNLDSVLWSKGIRYLLINGVSTNGCVETTARDLADRGFMCVLIEDGCGAAKLEYHQATLVTFQRNFGKVQTCEQVIKDLSSKLKA